MCVHVRSGVGAATAVLSKRCSSFRVFLPSVVHAVPQLNKKFDELAELVSVDKVDKVSVLSAAIDMITVRAVCLCHCPLTGAGVCAGYPLPRAWVVIHLQLRPASAACLPSRCCHFRAPSSLPHQAADVLNIML